MRNLKTSLIIMLAIFVASCGSLKMPSLHVNPDPLVNKGGKVSFTVKDTMPAKSFPKKAVVKIEPYLKYQGDSLPLEVMNLKGEKAPATATGTVVSYKTKTPLSYAATFDYKPEMETSELWAKVVSVKGTKETVVSNTKIADGIIVTANKISKSEIVAIADNGYEKETIISQKAKLYFDYNKSNLNTALKLNKDSKATMDSLNQFVAKGWKIKDVNVDAWASPEGELTLNQKLSDERGATAKKFIDGQIKKITKSKEDLTYNITSKGADYDGFMSALEKSSIKDKSTIANVIKSQSKKTDREQQIRNMTVIYSEVEDMLSVLRRAEIAVDCFEPKRTDEQIATLSTTHPDSLSVKELLYAATLTQDLNAQLAIYKAAIAKDGSSWAAYNNAAATDIKLGNADEAAQFLEKANSLNSESGEIANNMGILAVWNKDFTSAQKYYEKAQAAGINVDYNLGAIKMINGDYAGAEAAFSSKKCDYNMALAQLENGKTDDAVKTLDCSEQTAEVNYLRAVIGARTNNANMVVDNLTKAIAMNPSYKQEAAKDREFIKFATNAAFQALVK